MRICITMTVAQELADSGHPMGVTEPAYCQITEALSSFGDDISVEAEGYDAQ